MTRSNGGWSRSDRTDCARTAPASEASGRDSTGRGCTRSRISASASAGEGSSAMAAMAPCRATPRGLLVRLLVRIRLLLGVPAVDEGLQFVERSVVLLGVDRVERRLLLRELGIHVVERGGRVGPLLLEAGQVGLLDALDVFLDQAL